MDLPGRADASELREAATDPGVFHRPAPVNQFDPSRYRGPGTPILAPPAPSVPHVDLAVGDRVGHADGGVTGEALET